MDRVVFWTIWTSVVAEFRVIHFIVLNLVRVAAVF